MSLSAHKGKPVRIPHMVRFRRLMRAGSSAWSPRSKNGRLSLAYIDMSTTTSDWVTYARDQRKRVD